MPQRRPFTAELQVSRGRQEAPAKPASSAGAAPGAPPGDLAAAVREAVRQELPQALGAGLGPAISTAIGEAVERRLPDIVRDVVASQLPGVVHAVVGQAMGQGAEGTPDADGGETGSGDYMDLIHLELVELLDRIHHTRAEIASLRPREGDHDQIVTATAELESVVQATEQATGEILEAAEHLQGIAEAMAAASGEDGGTARGFADEIETEATKILTTCSFQDLTGQRITAAINTLLYVEESLTRVVDLWGITAGTGDANLMRNHPDDDRPDKHLLNGPQMEGHGVSQEDIDALFG